MLAKKENIFGIFIFSSKDRKTMANLSKQTNHFGAVTLSIMTFSIMTFIIMIFSIMAFSIMTFSIMTFSIMTFSIMTFSIMTFIIMTFSMKDLYETPSTSDNQHKRHSV